MSSITRVIAFERKGIVLIGGVEVEGDPLRVIAEGGGIVQVAADHVLKTFAGGVEGGTTREIGKELRGRRLDCEERIDL